MYAPCLHWRLTDQRISQRTFRLRKIIYSFKNCTLISQWGRRKNLLFLSKSIFSHPKYIPWKLQKQVIDWSRKILIFIDMPHNLVIERLRPMLSHDVKELLLKITDKGSSDKLKTKEIILKGFPSVIFCTSGLTIDKQELTRFFLLSPETNPTKIFEAIDVKVLRESNTLDFPHNLDKKPDRKMLIQRIRLIKEAHINNIIVREEDTKQIKERFKAGIIKPQPRHPQTQTQRRVAYKQWLRCEAERVFQE